MSNSSESRKFTEKTPDYPLEVRQAWTDVLISCWKEGDNGYIKSLRSNPSETLKGNAIIDESEGKYFPLPDEPPEDKIDSPEKEAALRKKLESELLEPPFGRMMIGGNWPDACDAEKWVDVVIRAWKESDFLERLRNNPEKTISEEYPEISMKFPISKEPPEALKGLKEDDLRQKLNDESDNYMGWMMTCCR